SPVRHLLRDGNTSEIGKAYKEGWVPQGYLKLCWNQHVAEGVCRGNGSSAKSVRSPMMSDDPYNVLFLSNRNTARSIFAEAVTNRLGQKRFRGFSAGINPAEKIDPLVFDVLKAAQYSTDGLRPKHWEEFAKADAPPLDFVFTLCDPMAGEPLPH